MWGTTIPYYEQQPSKRRPNTSKDIDFASHGPPLRSNNAPSPLDPASMSDMLEPSMDGPPSPERLRQLSKQMKRASFLHRGNGNHTIVSSSSSSTHSFTGERPAWENALDNLSLVRRPSDRSTDSSTPSCERPESVQVFGKNLFKGRARLKRESSSHSSSGNSSLYSTELPADNSGMSVLKESLMPTIFARRKPSRDESAQQKRLQISGPFNFQHVTHTQRENIPSIQRGSRMELAAEFSAMRTPGPTSAPGALRGIEAHEIQSGSYSTESLVEQDDAPLTAPIVRPPLLAHHTAPASGPRRLMKQARSQDHLRLRASPPRTTPTRPLRSPAEPPTEPSLPPVPPPRVSSRQSLHLDAFASGNLNRPQTSGGFHRPQPFNPSESPERTTPPATSHGYIPSSDFETFGVKEQRLSQSPSPGTPDSAWPLASPPNSSFESPLADVPEEEEMFGVSRKSRLSLTSNSSLRGSQSVPMLRSMSQSQRPMSGASETLGRFDMVAAQRAMRVGLDEEGEAVAEEVKSVRESWEDDIDYCYEHEVEANCDYQWERPSLDGSRNSHLPPVGVALADEDLTEIQPVVSHTAQSSRTLSPTSPTAMSLGGQEATMPTPVMTLGMTSNFSKKGPRPTMLKPMRPISVASSFKESQGFTLSPSLLIPGDYHQQMLLSEAEKQKYAEGEDAAGRGFNMGYMDGANSRLAKSPLINEQRSSTSTTETNSSSHSDSTGERHVSANSTWTTLTRLTASSTSLNKMAGSWTEASEPLPTTHFVENENEDEESTEKEMTPPATNDTVPELTPFPPALGMKKSFHKTHASESVARGDAPVMKSHEALMMRRPRARTTSMSSQAPPVGQYALFPRQFVKGAATGERI